MFIRNCWYMVAWEHEIPADGLFHRTVIDEPLLLFHTGDGGVLAREDRCCHRLPPCTKAAKRAIACAAATTGRCSTPRASASRPRALTSCRPRHGCAARRLSGLRQYPRRGDQKPLGVCVVGRGGAG